MKVSTPGRICLFGEHQDYLGLPVVAMAISKRVGIDGTQRADKQVIINMPNIGKTEQFTLEKPLTYNKNRDYFKSAINVLRRRGLIFEHGFEITIDGNIPINSGTSSSSALLVSWLHFLSKNAKNPKEFTKKEIGELAYEAEVLEFGEPGGMMDQYSTAVGNIIYLASTPVIQIEELKPNLGAFVLGDSVTPKDTLGILARCRFGMEAIIKKIKESESENKQVKFDIFETNLEDAEKYKGLLNDDEMGLLKANLEDRDILREGKKLLQNQEVDHQKFGELLNRHQKNLREYKRTSTPKIDRMIEAALNAGALGGKINGSGGGGCMFAYAPNDPEKVAAAIEAAGGKSFIITVDEGTRVEL